MDLFSASVLLSAKSVSVPAALAKGYNQIANNDWPDLLLRRLYFQHFSRLTTTASRRAQAAGVPPPSAHVKLWPATQKLKRSPV